MKWDYLAKDNDQICLPNLIHHKSWKLVEIWIIFKVFKEALIILQNLLAW